MLLIVFACSVAYLNPKVTYLGYLQLRGVPARHLWTNNQKQLQTRDTLHL